MNRPLRIALVGLALVVFLTTAAWLAARSYLQYVVDLHDDAQARTLQKHHQHFVADRSALAALPFFAGIGGARDAGALLNDKLSWRTSAPGTSTAALSLPPTLVAALQEESAAADAVVVTALTALDLSWFAGLHAFDHWRLDRAILSRRVDGDPLWEPMPDLGALRLWARLRLRLGLLNEDLTQASFDVQHLARLLVSTETLLGTMTAASILSDERAFVSASPDRAAFMKPWERDDVARLRRVARAAYAYVDVGDRSDTAAVAGVLDGTFALDCIALHEGLVTAWAFDEAADAWGLATVKTIPPAAANRCRFVDATGPDVVRDIVRGRAGDRDPMALWGCADERLKNTCRAARFAFVLDSDGDRALRAIAATSDRGFTGLRVYDEAP